MAGCIAIDAMQSAEDRIGKYEPEWTIRFIL